MRIHLSTIVMLTCALGSGASVADDFDPQAALQLIDKKMRAVGEAAMSIRIDSDRRSIRGTYHTSKHHSAMGIAVRSPRSMRGTVVVSLSRSVWMHAPGKGSWQPRFGTTGLFGTVLTQYDFLPRPFSGAKARLVGSAQVGWYTCHVLRLTRNGVQSQRVWVDKNQRNLVKVQQLGKSGRVLRTTTYSGWHFTRLNEGPILWHPRRIQVKKELSPAVTVTLGKPGTRAASFAKRFPRVWPHAVTLLSPGPSSSAARQRRVLAVAQSYRRAGRYGDALRLLNGFVAKHPESSAARRLRAALNAKIGNVVDVLKDVSWWRQTYGDVAAEDLASAIRSSQRGSK